MLKEYKDCFVWDYDELLGLERELVEHKLPIKPGCKPIKQLTQRMTPEVIVKIKRGVKRLFKAGIIRIAKYVKLVPNVVPVIKKNGKLRICIDYRNLNSTIPKDEYPMPVVDLLINRSAGHSIIPMKDGYSWYN